MMLSNIRNEFLGCMGAITVQNTYEFEEMKQFMGIEGLFTKEGNIAQQMSCSKFPTTIYRDTEGMYVDCADDEYLKSMHYNIYDFDKVKGQSNEQLNFFGDETAPGIKQPDKSLLNDPMEDIPMEADVKVVENCLSLNEAFNSIVVGEVVPAEITGYSSEVKDIIINEVSKYKNTVVTVDNYSDLEKETLKDLRGKQKDIESARAKFKKKALEKVDVYVADMTEIANTLKDVIQTLKGNIDVFVEEENKRIKNDLLSEFINPTLDIMVANGAIDEKTRAEFQLNDRWLNKSARTSTGNLTTKTTDEINDELNRLAEMYAQKQKDIVTIKSTVENLADAHGVDKEALKADTYIDLYNSGFDMPQVQQRINIDLENIKRAVEREKEKARVEVENKHKEAIQSENTQQVQNNVAEETHIQKAENDKYMSHADEKTGEVFGLSNAEELILKRINTPEQLKDKTYTYTYEFSGDFGAIKTFSNILKILSKISNFKYIRK